MILRWFRSRRRRRLLAQPFPQHYQKHIDENVRHFAALSPEEQLRVRQSARVFIEEKNWEGCGGLEMTDEVKVTIAVQMALLVLGLTDEYFDHVLSILVYPDAYFAPEHSINQAGVVMERQSAREGEAWYRGPVVLSWQDVLAGGQGRSPGHNLVYHEFSHQLDMLNGRSADGVPPMDSRDQAERWYATFSKEYDQLCHDCRHRHRTVFDCYGATNRAEFFAVATEAFFEKTVTFHRHHETLFGLFREYYRQDPLARAYSGA